MIIVLTSVATAGEGEELARRIVESKLAACVQILPKITSVYFWEGKVESGPENLLLIKTLEEKFRALSEFIKTNHSYDVPEIVAIRAEHVSDIYLKWMADCLI
ncbi:MAG: divalent-cation tolerance protein CutA [Pyrinomonadaceae bacterium]